MAKKVSRMFYKIIRMLMFILSVIPTARGAVAGGDDVCHLARFIESRATFSNRDASDTEALNLLAKFEVPARGRQRALTLKCAVDLSAHLIASQKNGMAEDFFYDLYSDFPSEIKAVMKHLSAPQQHLLKETIKNQELIWSKGN